MSYERYSQRLLHLFILLILLLPYAPSDAAVGIFVLGLISRFRQKPRVLAVSHSWKLLLAVIALLLIEGTVFSIIPLESFKTSFRMLGAGLAIYGAAQVMLYSRQTFSEQYTAKALWMATAVLVVWYLHKLHACHWAAIGCGVEALQEQQNKWSTLMLMMVCAHAALFALKQRGKWPHLFMAALLSVAIIIIQGRGAFVTSVGIIALAVFFALRIKPFIIWLLGGMGLVTCALLYIAVPAIQQIITFNYIVVLLNGRIQLWTAALQVIQEHVLTGIGIGSWKFSEQANSLLPPVYKAQVSPHNLLLDLLVSVGSLGTVLFVVVLFLFKQMVEQAPLNISAVYRRFGLLILIAILVNGLIDFRLFATQFLSIAGIGLLLWRGGIHQPTAAEAPTTL